MDPEEDTKELSIIERLKAARLQAEGGQADPGPDVVKEPIDNKDFIETQKDIYEGTYTPPEDSSQEDFNSAFSEAQEKSSNQEAFEAAFEEANKNFLEMQDGFKASQEPEETVSEEDTESFTTSWTDDLSYVDAIKQHDDMIATIGEADSPFTFSMGSLIYTDKNGKNTFVPRPEPRTWDVAKSLWPFNDFNFEDIGSKVPLTSVAALGVRESLYDADELISAGKDKFGDVTGLYNSNTLDAAQKRSVDVNTGDSIIDAIVADGFPALLAGGGTGALVFKSMQTAPKVLRGLYKFAPKAMDRIGTTVRGATTALTGEAAAVATTGSDEETFRDWLNTEGMSETEADKLIGHRMNVFVEGMVLGGIVTGGALGGKALVMGAYDFLGRGVMDMFRGRSAVERQVYQEVTRRLGSLTSKSTAEEVSAIQAEIAEIVKENKEVMVKSLADLEKERPQQFTTVEALLRGDSDNLNPSVLRADQTGTANEVGNVPIQMTDGNNTTLNAEITAPTNALQDDLAQQRVALGGDGGQAEQVVMQDAANTLTDQSTRLIDDAVGGLADAQAKYDQSVQVILARTSDDAELIGQLQNLQAKYPDELADVSTANQKTLEAGLRNSYEALSNEKNRLYAKIQGGAVDVEGLVNTLEGLDPTFFDPARLGLKSNSMFGQFMNTVKNTTSKVDNLISQAESLELQLLDTALEPQKRVDLERSLNQINATLGPDRDKAVAKLVGEFFDTEGLDFGDLYTEVRPAVSQAANDLFNSSAVTDKAAGRVMRKFIDYIDNKAVDYVRDTSPELAQAAEEAKRFYEDDYAPFFSGNKNKEFAGVLSRYARLYDGTIGRTRGGDLTPRATGKEFGSRDYKEKLDALVKGEVLQSGSIPIFQNVADLLGKNLNGKILGEPSVLFDYMMFDILQQFHGKVRSGGMDSVDVGSIITALNKHAAVVSKVFPDKTSEIRQFVDQLEAVKGDAAKIESIFADASNAATDAKIKVYDSVLTKFWASRGNPKNAEAIKAGTKIVPTENPYGKFTKFFTGENALDDLTALMAEIDSLPKGEYAKSEGEIVMDGLKMAYNRFINEKLFTASRNLTGGQELSVRQAQNVVDEVGSPQFLDVARKIYADTPEWPDALAVATNSAKESTINKRATPNPAQSATNFNMNAQTATNRLIYTFIGPLSRTGTRLKALGAGIIQGFNPNEVAREVTAQLYADPDYFLELAKRYNRTPTDPLIEQLMVRYLIGGLIKTDLDDDSDARADTLMDAAGDVASAITPDVIESGFTSASDAAGILADQIAPAR